MKPSQLAARLRRIASGIEASRTPSRSLVSRDLRRVLASMSDPQIVLKSATLTTTPEDLAEDGWAEFLVEAVVEGVEVRGKMNIEMDGRDLGWEMEDSEAQERLDEATGYGWTSDLCVKVQESDAWRAAAKIYYDGEDPESPEGE